MQDFKLILLIISMCIAAACTPPMERDYVVDGGKGAGHARDLAECKRAAHGFQPDARRDGALIGAASGAVFGALDEDSDPGDGALAGAAIGALVGVSAAEDALRTERRRVVIRCMQNRGHRVIG